MSETFLVDRLQQARTKGPVNFQTCIHDDAREFTPARGAPSSTSSSSSISPSEFPTLAVRRTVDHSIPRLTLTAQYHILLRGSGSITGRVSISEPHPSPNCHFRRPTNQRSWRPTRSRSEGILFRVYQTAPEARSGRPAWPEFINGYEKLVGDVGTVATRMKMRLPLIPCLNS